MSPGGQNRVSLDSYEYRTFSELTGQHLMNVARLCSRRRGSHGITSSAQPLAILCAVRGCYFRRSIQALEPGARGRNGLSKSIEYESTRTGTT
jgi:hypothetical protein